MAAAVAVAAGAVAVVAGVDRTGTARRLQPMTATSRRAKRATAVTAMGLIEVQRTRLVLRATNIINATIMPPGTIVPPTCHRSTRSNLPRNNRAVSARSRVAVASLEHRMPNRPRPLVLKIAKMGRRVHGVQPTTPQMQGGRTRA
jgi:hypothetical protein